MKNSRMKTKVIIVLAILGITPVFAAAQENQSRFGFEISTGLSVATNKLADAALNTGFGVEGIFHYRFMQSTGVYAGWGWNRFSSDNSFAGINADFEETGYVMGLQFKQSVGRSPFSLYLRAGALYNHIEIENEEGDIINNSGHGWGWQAATGVDIRLSEKVSLTPGIKFNSLNRDIIFDGTARELKQNYLSFRIGLLKRF
ncbi:MAG: opacity protein [Bacteroidetes bacterium HGW-Bacteroidetes-5]|jgi:opacity protein-like surface antigen|nr:MAG: opacity protein [Bacteroidetes bacterium HGW-Bacteroidetes-5]